MVLSTPYVPTKRCIQETLGRFNYFVMPGLGYQIPIVHTIRIRALRENTMKIHPYTVITKDNVEIMVDGIMWARSTIVD